MNMGVCLTVTKPDKWPLLNIGKTSILKVTPSEEVVLRCTLANQPDSLFGEDDPHLRDAARWNLTQHDHVRHGLRDHGRVPLADEGAAPKPWQHWTSPAFSSLYGFAGRGAAHAELFGKIALGADDRRDAACQRNFTSNVIADCLECALRLDGRKVRLRLDIRVDIVSSDSGIRQLLAKQSAQG